MKTRNLNKMKEVPKAVRIFTDRDEPRESFWKKYDQAVESIQTGESDVSVLSFYGIGGIGKTSLLRQLRTEMKEKRDNSQYVYFDFTNQQDSHSFMKSIRNQLVEKYQYSFPLFDWGFYNYAKKIGEDVSRPEIQSVLSDNKVLSFALELAGEIPFFGTPIKLAKYADTFATISKDWLKKNSDEILEIEKKSTTELNHYLQTLFVKDLAKKLKLIKSPWLSF